VLFAEEMRLAEEAAKEAAERVARWLRWISARRK
jgi:hypothetical protein